jgi:hypothetical protein
VRAGEDVGAALLGAPELDPRLLVRMTAAGHTINDILGLTAGRLPAYRVTYLVDNAKEHVATVQSRQPAGAGRGARPGAWGLLHTATTTFALKDRRPASGWRPGRSTGPWSP